MTQERLQQIATEFKRAHLAKAEADQAVEDALSIQSKANFTFNGAKGELERAMYEFALFGIESRVGGIEFGPISSDGPISGGTIGEAIRPTDTGR